MSSPQLAARSGLPFCAATDVPEAIERLMNQFTENRKHGENLRQFFARHTNDDLRSILAGGFAASVERDTATTGPVPVGVEG